MVKQILILSLSLGLASCASPAPDPSPVVPTPFPEITTTPELQAWTTGRIVNFREIQGNDNFIGFGLQIRAPSSAIQAAEEQTAVLVVTSLEPPEGWFATPLHLEPVVLVANSVNEMQDLSADEVERILTGRISNWSDLGGPDLPVVPIVPLENSETRTYLEQVLLEGKRVAPTAIIGPSPDIVLELVNEDSGAIGIVPLSAAGEASVLAIDGVSPLEAGYPWTMEILGIAPVEPVGIVRDWLAWLQATSAGNP